VAILDAIEAMERRASGIRVFDGGPIEVCLERRRDAFGERARRGQQIAREPMLTVSSSSSTRTSTPRRARSIAAVNPTGPAPATITGQCRGAAASSGGLRYG